MNDMEAELLKELDDETWDAVSALVSLCNAADHTSYDTDLDGDFYYIIRNDDPEESGVEEELFAVLSGYLLGETIDGKQVLEVEAFTHPRMRQIGMFRMCYQSLLDDFRGYRIRFMIKRPIAGDDEPVYDRISFSDEDCSQDARDGSSSCEDQHEVGDSDMSGRPLRTATHRTATRHSVPLGRHISTMSCSWRRRSRARSPIRATASQTAMVKCISRRSAPTHSTSTASSSMIRISGRGMAAP